MIARAGDRTFIATANPGLLMSVSSARADARHLRVRRQRRAPGVDVGRGGLARAARRPARRSRSSRARATPGRRTKRGASGAAPYANRRRLADHQPEGALPAVARGADRDRGGGAGADVAVVGVPAAQHPAAGRRRSPFIRRASCSRSRSRAARPRSPGSTKTRRTSAPRRTAPLGGGAPPLGRRMFQRGLQTFEWKADDDNSDELSYDVFYRREGDTAWRSLRSICATRCWCGTPARCRTAPTS